MFLSIVIPCYNEELRLGKTLVAVRDFLAKKTYQSEVIIVDNGSKDKTSEVAMQFKNEIMNLRVINKKSHGKGWAVKEGMLEATGDYKLFMDADNATDINQLDDLFPFVQDGYDIVISSRKIEGAKIINPQPRFRVLLGNVFIFMVNRIVPLGIRDTQNGFKLFSKEASEIIFKHQSIYYWAFDVEILALGKVFGFKIKEVPITWIDDARSKMNIKGMIRMLFEVIITRLHLMTRIYIKK